MGLVKLETAVDKIPAGISLLAVHNAFGALVKRDVKRACLSHGGSRFWLEVADATRVLDVTEQGVTVENRHVAAAQKQYGGPIEAKKARALTIPVAPEAKGRRAGEFTDLKKISLDGKSLLGRQKGKKGFEALYVLVRRTRPQNPEPFWPDEETAGKLLKKAVSLAKLA